MAEISVPWGEKQAFKYVVDGEWKVREDEAKEWGGFVPFSWP